MEGALAPGPQADAAPLSREYASRSEWERVRPLIKQLYVDEDKSLKEVIDILFRDHGHSGTMRQYKSRMSSWGLDKKSKEAEARAVLRIKRQRDADGKASAFRVRGKPVAIEDVHRYFKRKGVANPDIEAQGPGVPTPPNIEYWTPLSSPSPRFESMPAAKEENMLLGAGLLEGRSAEWGAMSCTTILSSIQDHDDTPQEQSLEISHSLLPLQSHVVSEKLFASIKTYYSGAFNSKIFEIHEGGDFINLNSTNGNNHLSKFYYLCYTGASLMDSKSFDKGRQCFSRASNLVNGLLRNQNPRTLPCIFDTFIFLRRKGYNEVVMILRNFADGLATVLFAKMHPLRQIWTCIAALHDSNFEHTIMEAWRRICDTLATSLGKFHATTIFCCVGFLSRLDSSNNPSTQLLHSLLIQGEQALGRSDTRLLDIKFAYGRALYNQNREEEAMAILEEIRVLCKETGHTRLEINSLELLAHYQYFIGRFFEAESRIRQALNKNKSVFGNSDPVTLKLKTRLKSWMCEWGRDSEAEKLEQDNFEATDQDDIDQDDIDQDNTDKEEIDDDPIKHEIVETIWPDNIDGDIPRWDMELFVPATSSDPLISTSKIHDTTILQTVQGALTSSTTLCVETAVGPEEHREHFEDDHKRETPNVAPATSEQQGVDTEPYLKSGSMSALKTFDNDSVAGWSDDMTECSESDHTHSTPTLATHFIDACSVLMDGKQPLKSQRLNLSPLKSTLIERIMEEFWVIFGQQWSSNLRTHARTPSSSSPVSTREAGMTTTPSQHPGSQITNKKRSQGDRDDQQQDEDEGRNPKRPRQSGVGVDDDIATYLACPYRKRNPRTYSITEWKYCALTPYRSINRLKEHLYRRHRIGIRCTRCWDTFKSQDLLDDHQRMTVSCVLQPPQVSEGITPSMLTRIKSRKKTHPNQSEAEKWGEIYQILFPGELIPDPYFDPIQEPHVYSPNSQELASYESFSRQELPRVFRGRLEAAVTEGAQLLEEKLMGSLVDMIKDCQDRVFRSYQSRFRAASSPNDMPEGDFRTRPSSATPLAAFFQQPPLQDVEYIAPDVLEIQQQNTVQAPGFQGQYSDSGYSSMFNTQHSAQPQNAVQDPILQRSDSVYNSNIMSNSHSIAETENHNTGSHSYWCYNCNDSHNCLYHRAIHSNNGSCAILENSEGSVAPVSHFRSENMNLLNDASGLATTIETLENYSSNPRMSIDNVPHGLEQEAFDHDASAWRPNETYPEFPDCI